MKRRPQQQASSKRPQAAALATQACHLNQRAKPQATWTSAGHFPATTATFITIELLKRRNQKQQRDYQHDQTRETIAVETKNSHALRNKSDSYLEKTTLALVKFRKLKGAFLRLICHHSWSNNCEFFITYNNKSEFSNKILNSKLYPHTHTHYLDIIVIVNAKISTRKQ